MVGSGFVQVKGSPTVYQDKGNGVLDAIPNWNDFLARGGNQGQIQQVDNIDSYFQPQAQVQASAQVDPTLRATIDSLNAEKNTATTANQQILDALQKSFALKQQQDPYARSGSVSGQANAYGLDQQNTAITDQGKSLTAQLSDIAQRLTSANTSAATQKAGLVSSILDKYNSNNQAYQDKQNTRTTLDLGGSVAILDSKGNIVKQITKTAAPTSGSGTTQGNLNKLFKTALASGNYTATGEAGKASREDLINQLQGATGANRDVVKSLVYGNFTAPGEKPYVPGSGTTTAAEKQTQTNVAVAQTALQQLEDASNQINTADSKTSADYIKQMAGAAAGKIQGNNSAVAQLGLQGQAILTAVRALTNTGRVTQSEIDAIQLPTISDTKTQAQTKINALKSLLTKAAGGSLPQPSSGSSAPSAGGSLNNIWGF